MAGQNTRHPIRRRRDSTDGSPESNVGHVDERNEDRARAVELGAPADIDADLALVDEILGMIEDLLAVIVGRRPAA